MIKSQSKSIVLDYFSKGMYPNTGNKILAKQGPDSRFVLEASIKSMLPRSSRSSL